MIDGGRVASELFQLAVTSSRYRGGAAGRLALLVTPEEREALRRFCLDRDGYFTGRIGGLQVVVGEPSAEVRAEVAGA